MLNMGLCSLSSRYFGPKIQRSQHQPSRNDKESTLTCWPLTIVGTDRSPCGRLPTKLQNPTSTAMDAPTCIMWTLRCIVCPNSISGGLFIVKMREMYELIWKCLCIVCPNVSLQPNFTKVQEPAVFPNRTPRGDLSKKNYTTPPAGSFVREDGKCTGCSN